MLASLSVRIVVSVRPVSAFNDLPVQQRQFIKTVVELREPHHRVAIGEDEGSLVTLDHVCVGDQIVHRAFVDRTIWPLRIE